MKEIDFKYFNNLKHAEISFSKLPHAVTKSATFTFLVDAKVLAIVTVGRGKIVKVINEDAYKKFLETHFPDQINGDSRAANIAKLRNSKAVKRSSSNVCFLRGNEIINVNDKKVELSQYTNSFGLFSAYNPNIIVKNLCIIENLETFLNAEKLFEGSYTFLHKYGRIGSEFLRKIKTGSVLVFSDYDLIGLSEYLKVKEVFPEAIFYYPENFDKLFDKYSTELPEKQIASKAVKESKDPIVTKIREVVLRSNRYLEQEILLLENES